jgi:hypothetical protein
MSTCRAARRIWIPLIPTPRNSATHQREKSIPCHADAGLTSRPIRTFTTTDPARSPHYPDPTSASGSAIYQPRSAAPSETYIGLKE